MPDAGPVGPSPTGPTPTGPSPTDPVANPGPANPGPANPGPANPGPANPGAADAARGVTRGDRSPWNWLLLLPLVAVLYPPLYNRSNPWLFGMPFFYWFQLAVIPVSVVCTLLVYRAPHASGRGDDGRAAGSR
jgi:Protein of unknown function (DUF3311)